MRRRSPTGADPRDLGVLTLARAYLEMRGPLGDAQLVGMLAKSGIPARTARASLARLEAARELSFGPSGWQSASGRAAAFLPPASSTW